MLLADDFRRQRARIRGQRIHGGENAQLRNRPLQHDGRVQVRERRGRRRVGQIVRRHIHGLERGDRTFLGRGDAFLQIAHFRGERRLITDGAGRAAQQRGHFGTGLRKTENVVDEQQHVLVLLIAEIFRDGQTRKAPTRRRAPGGSFIWP